MKQFAYHLRLKIYAKFTRSQRIYQLVPMECQQKDRLMKEYRSATDAYSRAVQQLHDKTGVSAKVEYEHLAADAEESRARSEKARKEMELHIALHEC